MTKIYTAKDFLQITDIVYKLAGWNYNLNTLNPKHKKLQEVFYWTLNVLFMVILMQAFITLNMNIRKIEKFLESTEIMVCIGFVFILVLKSYFVVYKNREIFTELIDDLDDLIPKTQHVQVEFGIKNYCEWNKLISIACSVTYTSILASFIFLPFSKKLFYAMSDEKVNWDLPFQFYYPFDSTNGYIYPILYIYESSLTYKCTVEVLGSDLILYNVISIITMRIEMLSNEIKEIDAKKTKISVEKLKEISAVHNKLYELNEKIEKLYSISLLGDLLASTVITCLAAFNTFLGTKGFPLVKFIDCFFASLFRIGMQCYHVDRLTRASLKLADAAFENIWYEGSQVYKKNLLFIIMRAQKPLKITAYKFQALSLESFTHFVRSSYSLFAVLQTLFHADA